MKGVRIISSVKTETAPYFPNMTGNKTSRVVTKHFTNLPMYMDLQELSLLNWLIYELDADNSIRFSVFLMQKYAYTVQHANREYADRSVIAKFQVKRTPITIRETLVSLVKKGYLLSAGGNVLLMSPMLTYRSDYLTAAEYDVVCERYQKLKLDEDSVHAFIVNYRYKINKKYKKRA